MVFSVLGWLRIGVGLAILVLGVVICVRSLQEISRARNSRNWPTARGVVSASGPREADPRESEGAGLVSRLLSGFEPTHVVRYDYSTRGAPRSSQSIDYLDHLALAWFGERAGPPWYALYAVVNIKGKSEQLREVHRFPVGRPVRVAYDPERPWVSVLRTGSSGGLRVPLLMGALVMAWGMSVGLGAVFQRFQIQFNGSGFVTAVACLLLLIAAIALVRSGGTMKRRGEESLKWPTTNGTVVASFIAPGYKTLFTPHVIYTYELGSELYAGHLLSLGSDDMRREAAQAVADAHPEGSTVTVHYDPKNPEVALLTPGVAEGGRRNTYFLSLILFAFGIPGTIVLVVQLVKLGLGIRRAIDLAGTS